MQKQNLIRNLARRSLLSLVAIAGLTASLQAQTCSTAFCRLNMNSTIYINNNTWGSGSSSAGWWETITVSGANSWRTDFYWPTQNNANDNGVKAYPSAVLGWHWGWQFASGTGLPTQLSANQNVNSSYNYSVTFGGGVGNVAYDLWLTTQSNPDWSTTPSDEIMIWVNNTGAGPISQTTVTTGISIGGATWSLHRGNIGWNVWSFVRSGNSSSGTLNMKDFTDYLRNNWGLSSSKYLASVQFGTEVFRGTGNLNVSSFTCTVGGAGGGGGTTYYKLKNRATGLCVDGRGTTANGANCGQWADVTSNNLHWSIVAAGSYVKLQNRATGLYVDGMGRTANGSIAGLWASSTSNNQQWTQSTTSGYYKYQNRATGLYLDGAGATGNGANLLQYASSTSNNQQFSRLQQ